MHKLTKSLGLSRFISMVSLAGLTLTTPAIAQLSPDFSGGAAAAFGQAHVASGIPQELLKVHREAKSSFASNSSRVLVGLADDGNAKQSLAWLDSLTGQAKAGLPTVRSVHQGPKGAFHILELDGSAKMRGLVDWIQAQPGVLWAEEDGVMSGSLTPNEGFYDNFNGNATDLQKWTYDGIGSDRNINAEAAWDSQTGRQDVVIAIVDSGTDWFYTDLFGNLVTNGGEVPGDGVDNDGNGFVDDAIGWDFIDGDNDPTAFPWGDGVDGDGDGTPDDGVWHGTFVGTNALAIGNNNTDVVGACWNCGLIPVRVLDDENNGPFSAIASGIYYAVDRGASIINLSLGGGFSNAVANAIGYAFANDVLVVASAGNGNTSQSTYPASLSGVLGVGATDSASVTLGGSGDLDGRASFSNWGLNTRVVAPGVHQIGLRPRSVGEGTPGTATVGFGGGTSFAAPLVSGLAGLIYSEGLDLGTSFSAPLVKFIIEFTANDLPDDPNDSPNAGSGWDGQGRVDFEGALDAAGFFAF